MGLFDWIFKKPNVDVARQNDGYFKTLTAYKPHFTTWQGEIYESELVRSAIDARARHISKLKVEILGSAKPTLQTKLRLKPNNWQTWSQFLYRASTILDMHNSCVIVPVYDELMNIVGYTPVLPNRCEIVEVDGVPFLRYEFTHGLKAANYLSECAILTKFQYKNDFFGESNHALDPTMSLIHLNNESVKEAVTNGASYRFIARVNNFSKTEQLKQERQRFNEANFKSEDGNSGLLLFPNTYTDIRQIEQDAYTVPEAELKEIRTNVYNYFAVNEEILQSKAYGDAWAAYYESVIEPFAIQFSETMTQAMFSDRERAQGSLIMASSNRLQYMTTSEKLSVSSQMADRGILNRDEIRDIWNLPPLPNGQGQAYTIRGEYYLMNEDGSFTREGTEENRNKYISAEYRNTNKAKTIAVDFDGTLCTNMYPKIGEPNGELIERLKRAKNDGNKIILWSCREGDLLDDAVKWCETRGLFFDEINGNLEERVNKYGYDPRKVSADLYIDDKCENVSA